MTDKLSRTGLKDSFVTMLGRCEARRGERAKKPEVYPLRYTEDFFAKVKRSRSPHTPTGAEDIFETGSSKSESGYMLVAVLILVMITAFAGASITGALGSGIKTISTTDSRTKQFFDNERALGEALQWLRDNSSGMANIFGRSKFYTVFTRRTAQIGANDQGTFQVPTKIGLRTASDQSIILTSDPILLRADAQSSAAGAFPASTDTKTGASFDALNSLLSTSFSSKKVRITLVDAIPVDPSKDYGESGVMPQTDFQPLYRIDVLDRAQVSRTESATAAQEGGSRTFLRDKGAHLFGHVLGKLQYDFGVGFYGRDYVEVRQPCNSYISNNGPYSPQVARSNCPIGSNATVSILNNTDVYGSVHTNGTINSVAPFGGRICGDTRCSSTGSRCEGTTCEVPGLPSYNSWSTYCPTNRGEVTPASGSLLIASGNAPHQRCWAKVRIGSNRVVTLTSTEYPYFIDELELSSMGRMNFAPSPPHGTVTLYVKKVSGDTFNGNQLFNINNKPYQLRLHYLGDTTLRLNGTANINAFIVAPTAQVNVQGNFVFKGGIKATGLTFTGNGSLHYDESGDITTLKGVSYQLRNVTQFYRD